MRSWEQNSSSSEMRYCVSLCSWILLDTAYLKLSAAARLSYKAAQAVDRLRIALDRQAFLDYCQWEAQEKAQFKGSRTYFPRDNARIND
jgi:hypothetical protein